MKYQTTEKHPVYKKGLLIALDEDSGYEIYPDESKMAEVWGDTISERQLAIGLEEGWLEPISDKPVDISLARINQEIENIKDVITGLEETLIYTRGNGKDYLRTEIAKHRNYLTAYKQIVEGFPIEVGSY